MLCLHAVEDLGLVQLLHTLKTHVSSTFLVIKAPAILLPTFILVGYFYSFVGKVNDWVYFGLLSFSLFLLSPQSPHIHTHTKEKSFIILEFGTVACLYILLSPYICG